jgi:hypothetical protein
MIRPARFGANPETADSNRFQRDGADAGTPEAARREFDGLVARLQEAGVSVEVAEDTPEPAKPDACFPNNWVSFHDDGSVVLYPLMAPSRRAERRVEPIAQLRDAGYRVARTIDLSPWEARGEFLEGTGSLVLDRCHRIAYACRSPRTTALALADFAGRLGYRTVAFDARGRTAGPPITRIADGDRRAFRGGLRRSIPDPRSEPRCCAAARCRAQRSASASRRTASPATCRRSRFDGGQVIAMSDTAGHSLAPATRSALERHGRIVTAPIPTIERHGGGSVRCMIAEVFLPRGTRGDRC